MPGLGVMAAIAVSTVVQQSSIDGLWRSPGGNSILKIAPCGHGPCGTVAWATDKAKKDASRTTKHLVGTHLVTRLEPRKDGSWKGRLFIPDQNMHVMAKIQRLSSDQLKVSGCAGGFLCKSAIWTSFRGSLPIDTSRPALK